MRWSQEELDKWVSQAKQAGIRAVLNASSSKGGEIPPKHPAPVKCRGNDWSVFAIDPGSEQSAFVIWDGQSISRKGKHDNDYILNQIGLCSDVYEKLVIEMVASYGMPVGKEVFDTCVWIGRFVETGLSFGKQPELIFRRTVKTHLCQDSRAKDSNIRQALIDRFGPIGTTRKPNFVYGESFHKGDKLKADVWQAFALAVTWWDLQTHGNSR